MKRIITAFLIVLTSLNFGWGQTQLTPSAYTYVLNPASGYPDNPAGQLTNGQNPTCVWPSTCNFTEFVGWSGTSPEFTFNFPTTVEIASIKIWMADSDGSAGVALPVSATIDPNGTNQTITISNPTGTGLREVILSLPTKIIGNAVTIRLNRNTDQVWTMISEVQVFGLPSSWIGNLIISNATTYSSSLDLTGTGSLTKSGLGQLILLGDNSFSGGFSIEGGSGNNSIIQASSSNAFGTGVVEILGGAGNTGSTLDLNGQSLTNDITIGNKNSGVNNQGAIVNTDISNPATLNGTVVIGGEIYAGGDGDIIFNSLVTGGLSNIYSIYKMGSGTWRFTNNANTFDGFFYLIGGEVEVTSLANSGEASSLGQVSASQNLLKFGFNGNGGGTLRFVGSSANNSDRTFEMMGDAAITNRIESDGADANASLALTGNLSPVRLGNYTLALGGDNTGDNTFSGVLSDGSGNLALEKDDAGTWILSGTNTYTGTTSINAGKLIINGDHSAVSGAVTVGNGATLGGSGSIGGVINFQNGSFFNPGNSPGILTAQTGLTLQTGNTFNWELAANESTPANRGTTYDGVDVTGGGLTIETGVTANLDFTVGVDFTDAFWQSPQQWLVFDNGNSPTLNSGDIFDAITFTNDANGQALTGVSGLSAAYFYWSQSGNDVYLNYSPTGPASEVTSTVMVDLNSIVKNGGTSTLTVQLKDANGNNMTAGGETITFAATTLGTIGAVTDNGDGTYTATYTAGATTGAETITPILNGTNFTNTITITIVDQVLSGTQILDGTSGNTQITDVFTTDGNLSLSQGFFVDYLIVGGGGGRTFNNNGYASGGGGGDVKLGQYIVSSGQYPIVVGNGTATQNGSGQSSSAFGVTAAAGYMSATNRGGYSGNGNAGGTKTYDGAGGGGAAGVGKSNDYLGYRHGGDGGPGINSSITGTTLMYGFGGGGGGTSANRNPTSYNGDGTSAQPRANSGGGAYAGASGAFGAAGIVVLRYPSETPFSILSGAVTSFIGDGTIGENGVDYQVHSYASGTTNLDITTSSLDSRLGAVLTQSIGGFGNLSYAGPGRLTLTQNNTYTGTTDVSFGTLQIGEGGTTGSLGSGLISVGSTGKIVINRSNEYTMPAIVSGAGTLAQEGSGTLNLGGLTHSVANFTLQAGSVSNGSLNGTSVDLIDGTSSVLITGAASVTKSGGGSATLTADNDYSGNTTVSEGTLVVNGDQTSATGAVSVESGATLKGSGTLGGATTVKQGGTLLPGNSIGTLAIANNLTWEAGGNYNWQITDATGTAGTSGWDLITVNGALTISSTSANPFSINIWSILVDGSSGAVANFNTAENSYTWTILTATSISGFDASKFDINTNPANGTGGLYGMNDDANFTIISENNALKLVYSPPTHQTIDGTNNGLRSDNFTTNVVGGVLTVDLGFFADALVVGGGGARTFVNGYPSGGGGGDVQFRSGLRLTEQSYTLTVGAGGQTQNYGGQASSAFGITANPATIPSTSRGGYSGNGFAGGVHSFDGAGGGGAAGVGKNANYLGFRHGGDGGAGVLSDITGTSLMYGFGGGGASTTAGRNPTSYNGDGTATVPRANSGGGAYAPLSTSGADGVVILRYAGPSIVDGTAANGSGTASGFTVHTFTSSSNFDLSAVDFNARLKATLSGNIVGSGDLIYDSEGQLTLTGPAHTYSGATEIKNGELRVNSDISSSSGVTVDAGATLSGTGTLPTSIINGEHNPGNSPGLQSFSGDLTYSAGSTLNWELAQNAADINNRGTDYDAINVTGDLDFAGATTLNLVFDAAGSAVDWSDTFWDSPATGTNGWKLFEVTGTINNLSNLTINVVDWTDSQSALASARSGVALPAFKLVQDGNGVYISYEPPLPDLTLSTVTAVSSTITINGTSTITLQLKDQNGNNFPNSGGNITFATTLGSIGTVTDNNDGTYTATFTAGSTAGTVIVTASLDGQALTNIIDITIVSQLLSGNQTIDGTSGNNEISDFFSTNGNLNLTQRFQLEYLIVAGGGAGGSTAGGGGGGGGFVEGVFLNPSQSQNYTIAVGAGGVANSGNGGSSSLGSFTAIGGGGNRIVVTGTENTNGAVGGLSQQDGASFGGFGFNGGRGRGINGNNTKGGGGGGAGAPGQDGPNGFNAAGNGGIGRVSDITGAPLIYAAGGGGGAGSSIGSGGLGGNDIGGDGGKGTNAGSAGMNGRGSGGGGGGAVSGGGGAGGAGGAGIVVFRYEGPSILNNDPANGTDSATGYTVHTFTSNGIFDLSQVDFNARLKATLTGNIIGNGDLIYDSKGRLNLTGTSHTYTGATTIQNGELRVNSNITSSSGLIVAAGAILSGTGNLPPIDVYGKHRPGNSPGVQWVHGSATYHRGAIIEWELNSNDAGLRGFDFDGIDVLGDLLFEPGAMLELVFDHAGSQVNWEDAYWTEDTPKRWKLFELTANSRVEGLATLSTQMVSEWKDALGRHFETVHPDKEIQMQLIQEANGIYVELLVVSKVYISFHSQEIEKQE